jgi:hypothetical protein
MWFRKKPEPTPLPEPKKSIFSTHVFDETLHESKLRNAADVARLYESQIPKVASGAMDDASGGAWPSLKFAYQQPALSSALIDWYNSQSGFIGYQLCAIMMKHWLIDKACTIPARDAVRKGYTIAAAHGAELPIEALEILKYYDKRYQLNSHMVDLVRKGRGFGVRICVFKIDSDDEKFYEKPFNIDGVKPGSYRGMKCVDPYWTAPMLDAVDSAQADALHFYEPTWWIIGNVKYHRSHLIVFRNSPPADLLAPQYMYGGVPLTQQIYERVYAAERVANEAPLLCLTKRANVWLTDMVAMASKGDQAIDKIMQFAKYRDNYGIQLGDKESEEFQQFDIGLADLDAVIMGQFQIVAAIAGVPGTKLLETTPKGFQSTGEFELQSYHEMLESIQTHDLTPMAERHHLLVMKSFIEPRLKIASIDTEVSWNALDSPTAIEAANIELVKAQTGQVLIESGAIDGYTEAQRLARDKESDYSALIGDRNEDQEEPETDV